jgi:hypothetical protein
MNPTIDLFEPLDRFPAYTEFWLFADDAHKALSEIPFDTRNVRVRICRSGIAVVRRNPEASEGEIETCEYIDASVGRARWLKGVHWRHPTYGILVGVPPKILVMQWDERRWIPYAGGLVTWLKATLLSERDKTRESQAPLQLDTPSSIRIETSTEGNTISYTFTGQPIETPLTKARRIIHRLRAQVAECRPKACVVDSLELMLLCGLAEQAVAIAENVDLRMRVDPDLGDEWP